MANCNHQLNTTVQVSSSLRAQSTDPTAAVSEWSGRPAADTGPTPVSQSNNTTLSTRPPPAPESPRSAGPGSILHGLPACGLNLSLSSHRAYKTQLTPTRLLEKACRRSTGGGLRTNQRPRRPEIQGGVTAGQPMRGRVLKAETSGKKSIIISPGELCY